MFLGNMAPGQGLQSIENKLYRAPVFRQRAPQADFLIIRTKDKFFIREIVCIAWHHSEAGFTTITQLFCLQFMPPYFFAMHSQPFIYVVGQTLPKLEVVPPSSRKANLYLNKRLEVCVGDSMQASAETTFV